MNEDRYQELLEKCLEGTLAPAEADELHKELAASPVRAKDAREQLAFGDLLSQELAPGREFSAFWGRLQQAIAREGTDVVSTGSLPQPSTASSFGMRLRYALYGATTAAAILLFFFFALMRGPANDRGGAGGPPSAIAQGEEISLKGEVVCTHCILQETQDCGLAVRVTDKGQVYYLSDNDISREFKGRQGCCRKPCPVVAKGTVQEKQGQSVFVALQLQPRE